MLSSIHISDLSYDLQSRRYIVAGLENEEKRPQFGLKATLQDFSTAALRRSGH
ncbi:hypothetical protein D3C84_1049960 [compost metagenome]